MLSWSVNTQHAPWQQLYICSSFNMMELKTGIRGISCKTFATKLRGSSLSKYTCVSCTCPGGLCWGSNSVSVLQDRMLRWGFKVRVCVSTPCHHLNFLFAFMCLIQKEHPLCEVISDLVLKMGKVHWNNLYVEQCTKWKFWCSRSVLKRSEK